MRINDRFPSHKGRAIDLSRGAAKAIGLIGPGTGQVRLEVVELSAGEICIGQRGARSSTG